MKKALSIFLLAGALVAPAFAQLDETESAFFQKCCDNVDQEKKQLSPDVAKECIIKLNASNAALLNKLRQETSASGNSAAVSDMLFYNNALIDLKNIVSRYQGRDLSAALKRVLERDSCALCDLGLGPKPERMFDWTDEKAGGRLFEVKKSVRTWEALGDIRIGLLLKPEYGYNKDKWNAQAIEERYQSLSNWARKEVDKLEKFAAMSDKPAGSTGYITKMAGLLREDLIMDGDGPYVEKLYDLVSDVFKTGDKSVAGAGAKDDEKLKKLSSASAKVAGLQGMSALSRQDYLNKSFDNLDAAKSGGPTPAGGTAGVSGGTPGAAFKPAPLTEEQAKALSAKMAAVGKDGMLAGYLADEIKGTKAGDEVLSFYNDRKYDKTGFNDLNLKFEEGKGDTAGFLGWWSASDKTLCVNTRLVDAYCEKNRITPGQLLASGEHLKGVATYVAPNFVHESTHQRQTAWAAANGLDFKKYSDGTTGAPYQMEKETESFSMQAAFSAEKAGKLGPAYLTKISPSHAQNAVVFMEDGVDALRTDKHARYANIDSMEGSAAREFKSAEGMSQFVAVLEQKHRTNPASITEKGKANLAEARGLLDSRYKWYTMVYQKSAADEAKLLAWRDSFDSEPAMSKAPPAL